jgi:hypothetical protein
MRITNKEKILKKYLKACAEWREIIYLNNKRHPNLSQIEIEQEQVASEEVEKLGKLLKRENIFDKI